MSRTATCFFALGVCVALAAACGDDEGGDGGAGSGGMGGSGGSAGSGGSGGNGGSAGGGAGQTGGGAGGTAGGGNAGSGAGTAGAGQAGAGQAGSGTVEPPDAGPDGSVESDASTDPPDSGPSTPADSGVNGDCTGFTTGLTTLAAQAGQDVIIARVIFNDDDETATVVLRVVNPDVFAFGGEQVLCFGASNSECVAVDDNVTGDLPAGTELEVVVGLGVPVVGAAVTSQVAVDDVEGELFFAAEVPQNDPQTIYAYVNWGAHESADVDAGGPLPSLEGFAVAGNRWTADDTIVIDGDDNAFFVLGDTSVDTGFDSCSADQF